MCNLKIVMVVMSGIQALMQFMLRNGAYRYLPISNNLHE